MKENEYSNNRNRFLLNWQQLQLLYYYHTNTHAYAFVPWVFNNSMSFFFFYLLFEHPRPDLALFQHAGFTGCRYYGTIIIIITSVFIFKQNETCSRNRVDPKENRTGSAVVRLRRRTNKTLKVCSSRSRVKFSKTRILRIKVEKYHNILGFWMSSSLIAELHLITSLYE